MKKNVLLAILLLVLITTSCRRIPEICDNCKYPFIVGKIESYDETMSIYYSYSYDNGSGETFDKKSAIILPTRMFNIGDTIRPADFIKICNDSIK